ncbi:MAG: tRNA (cytidine(56)-2'-O)-methyltransferase [Promethearchaeota archaeon]
MVTILRIGHRVNRDKRITTHLALVARAFGAEHLVIAGDEDKKLSKTLEKVVSEWGGSFQLELIPYDDWKTFLQTWKSDPQKGIVHLTMYGENLSVFEKKEEFMSLKELSQKPSSLLVVVGGEKIPGKVFQYANWNIAISNQPHSEVASLAVFLDHINSNALQIQFSDALKQVVPSLKGKKNMSGDKNNGR